MEGTRWLPHARHHASACSTLNGSFRSSHSFCIDHSCTLSYHAIISRACPSVMCLFVAWWVGRLTFILFYFITTPIHSKTTSSELRNYQPIRDNFRLDLNESIPSPQLNRSLHNLLFHHMDYLRLFNNLLKQEVSPT